MPDFEAWHQLQYWLADGERRVDVPFAEKLAELIEPVDVRLRRDFPTVHALVSAHALLHRANRRVNADGWVTATLDDYTAVRELMKGLLSDTLGVKMSKATRETVQAVRELTCDEDGEPRPFVYASYQELEERLKIGKGSMWQRWSRRSTAAIWLMNRTFDTDGAS